MASSLASRVAPMERTASFLRLSLNFFRNFSSSSTTANAAASTNPTASAAAKKPKRKKKKNLFEVAQFLPNWGIGYHMAKTHWIGVSYQISKINLYKDGRHGKAWGIVHKDGLPAADAPKKISGKFKQLDAISLVFWFQLMGVIQASPRKVSCFLSANELGRPWLCEIICEELPVGLCSFSIASSGKRCVLETYASNEGTLEFQCKTSEVVVENMPEWIESDECTSACGVDRYSVGISSDSLVDPQSSAKLCSPACYQNCPNIVDLYHNLALAEGVVLADLCKAQRTNPRREMAQLVSSGEAYGPASTAAYGPASGAAYGPASGAAYGPTSDEADGPISSGLSESLACAPATM
ncbi:hypothetical protein F0562_001030 [Nyssa sinensis]|uniref:Uncharacterized protein n=1 Tax=Nyssa sinensis TaxID=561372 RepID=A0A5J5C309_9ASTE|nr:hypothetical protein F0562_001030 [Nyssa sinensis]